MIAVAMAAQPVFAETDSRSNDAVFAFDDLCVSLFTGEESKAAPGRFVVTKLSDKTVRKIKPGLKGQTLWDVSGPQSDVHMLVHYDPTGLCVVEVAEADESAIRAEFDQLVQRVAKVFDSAPQREADKLHRIEGQDTTTSGWRIKSPKGDVFLAITTNPSRKFMIQHLMTASFVR